MLAAILALALAQQDGATLFPSEFTLHGPASRQTLLLESVRGGLYTGALKDVVYESSDSTVVKIVNGMAVPVGNGKATLTTTRGGTTSIAKVSVVDMDKAFDQSFRNHVQPIIARFGCSS